MRHAIHACAASLLVAATVFTGPAATAAAPSGPAEVRATVVANRNEVAASGRTAATVTTLEVRQTLRGRTARRIEVESAGGVLPNGLRMSTTHQPRFTVGDTVRISLAPWHGRYQVVEGDERLFTAALGGGTGDCSDPYCLSGSRWAVEDLPVHFSVNANTSDTTGEAQAVIDAALLWENDSGSVMDWTYDGSTSGTSTAADGVNKIYWSATRTIAGCGTYSACTSRWTNGEGELVEFDVEVYDGESWSTDNSTYADVETALAHELGHALGLDHTTVSGNRMVTPLSPSYAHSLGSGDVAGVRALYPPTCSDWCLSNSNTSASPTITFTFGATNDIAVVGDWDGDGDFTPGTVHDTGTHWEWHLRNVASGGGSSITVFEFGSNATVPIVGDWDGNGTWTVGVVDGTTRHLRNSNTGGGSDITPYSFGASGDLPVTGDWDGNGTFTPGTVHNTGTQWEWHLRNSNTGGGSSITVFVFGGSSGTTPVVGDWDGDGDWTIGVVDSEWHLRNSNDGGLSSITPFAFNDGVPVPGDWDANGTVTAGIRR